MVASARAEASATGTRTPPAHRRASTDRKATRSLATTGAPAAIASSRTMPKLSPPVFGRDHHVDAGQCARLVLVGHPAQELGAIAKALRQLLLASSTSPGPTTSSRASGRAVGDRRERLEQDVQALARLVHAAQEAERPLRRGRRPGNGERIGERARSRPRSGSAPRHRRGAATTVRRASSLTAIRACTFSSVADRRPYPATMDRTLTLVRGVERGHDRPERRPARHHADARRDR